MLEQTKNSSILKGCTWNNLQTKAHERKGNEIIILIFFGLGSVKALYKQVTPFKQEPSKIVSKCILSQNTFLKENKENHQNVYIFGRHSPWFFTLDRLTHETEAMSVLSGRYHHKTSSAANSVSSRSQGDPFGVWRVNLTTRRQTIIFGYTSVCHQVCADQSILLV